MGPNNKQEDKYAINDVTKTGIGLWNITKSNRKLLSKTEHITLFVTQENVTARKLSN